MKIAAISCSGSINIGNEFIAAGGNHLLRTWAAGQSDVTVFPYEFLDSANGQVFTEPGDLFTASARRFIDSCDLVLVFAGSILSEFCVPFLDGLASLKPPKVLLGASCWRFDQAEGALCERIATRFDAVFTRDDSTLARFGGAPNAYPGIDLAFFAEDVCRPNPEAGDYALVNLDVIRRRRADALKAHRRLGRTYRNVYILENSHSRYRDMPEAYIWPSYWTSFWNLYANAAFVLTNRVHTVMACLLNATPFEYDHLDASNQHDAGLSGRSALFLKVDLDLGSRQAFNSDALLAFRPAIDRAKQAFTAQVHAFLDRHVRT